MTVLLTTLLVGAIVLLGWQYRVLRTEREHTRKAERELARMGALTGAVSGLDWHRSIQNLVAALVNSGACRGAMLLTAAENGGQECRAEAWAPGEARWDPTTCDGFRRVTEGHGPVAEGERWYLPVIDERDVVGVLAVTGAVPESAAMQMALKLAGLGLTGMRLFQKQTVLSNTDGLTGLANHRYFQQCLSVALAQAYLEGEPLSVILLDIDRFKHVNDTYGHLFGDLVLRELAYLLRRELPPEAIPARYGGEELVVILRGPDALQAGGIAEQVRQAIEQHQILEPSTGARLAVTVSLGVADYELGQGKGRLMARADEALYASKHGGRNRVTSATRENSTTHLFPS